uniref:GCR101 n=1 Tax=Schmidtea mediterranea TaxID=79327 RepID=A0A193KUR7_SCHMD|nr:GCR101 [Schmidtea mediterranea]
MEIENCSDILETSNNAANVSASLSLLLYRFHNHALLILPILSMVLNGFCLFIFFDKIWRKSTLSILLKYLSATEIAFNFSGFICTITKFIDYPSIGYFSKLFWVFVLQVGTFSVSTALICRNWTILHLAAFRFESICRPLSSRKLYTNKYSPRVLWLTYVLAGIFAFPRTFEYEPSFCKGELSLNPGLIKYHWYEYGYQGSLIFIIQTAAPVAITSVLSFGVMKAIFKMKKFRQSCSKKFHKKHNAVSGDFLMIFICFAFFILEIPSFFSKVLKSYLMKHQKFTEDILLATMGNLLVYLDSVINIFVYIISNPTFRERSKNLFQPKRDLKSDSKIGKTALSKMEIKCDNDFDSNEI